MRASVFVLCCWSSIASAQPAQTAAPRSAELRGVVLDSAGNRITGVEILGIPPAWHAVTDDSGRFAADMDAGISRIVARRLGFVPESLTVMLGAGERSRVRIVLRPASAVQLAEVIVNGVAVPSRLHGFEHRRTQRLGGHFITRQDIEKQSPLLASDLLRRVHGIKVVDSMGVALAISTRGSRNTVIRGRSTPAQCVVRVAVDGFLKEPFFPMNAISQQDIHGVEVYAGPSSIPTEFVGVRRDAACGLIVIWTR